MAKVKKSIICFVTAVCIVLAAVLNLITVGAYTEVNSNFGDVNGDGRVDPLDLMILARYVAGWSGYDDSKINTANSDVNCDSRINSADVVILARHLANKKGYSKLPYLTEERKKTVPLNTPEIMIDVSTHQGKIDWKAVAQSGVKYAMIRAGYGNCLYEVKSDKTVAVQIDKNAGYNIEKAKENGIKIGIYWYSYADSVRDAQKEAEVCLSVLSSLGITPNDLELPVAFDIEEKSRNSNSLKRQNTDIVHAFCKSIAAAGYTPMVYSYSNFFQNATYYKEFKDYYIWFAHWTKEGLNKVKLDGLNIDVWQYGYAPKDLIKGIAGDVDINRTYWDFNCNYNPKQYTASVIKKKANNSAEIYSKPVETSQKVGTVNKGTQMKLLFVYGGWSYVYTDNGFQGFIKSSKIS